jgi:Cytidylyltransferase-like
MAWQDILKEAGVSIHVIATGAGAGIVQQLWEVPGSSAYLSGYSFPYAQEEQIELLGFTPEHYCSEEAAVDLASAAYMKAYRLGGKKPVGIGLSASVASEKEHRGDHRVFSCVMTDDMIRTDHYNLIKGSGDVVRKLDGASCDRTMFSLLSDAVGLDNKAFCMSAKEATPLATERFFLRPFFHANGIRDNGGLQGNEALIAGAFNPPHEGHFGMVQAYKHKTGWDVIFEITVDPPHKAALTVQDMLKRAKLLQGYNRIFSKGDLLYLDKARRFPGHPILMGADAAIRLLDPKWGINQSNLLLELEKLKTTIYVFDRMTDGKLANLADVAEKITDDNLVDLFFSIFKNTLDGRWDISSTELRNRH